MLSSGSTSGSGGGMATASSAITGTSYSNERPDADYANDPASGGFFHADFKKHDDLKQMLDSNKDSLKLEAMKRIIGMIAKGRDASELFPAVVKNVVSKNIEVKKLVYVYLVRYAEEQQDLALLSISTFQRALKDPNQLIRASALRVLSSIRVSMIVPIVMLAIRDSSADMSPYVRKTAAHAIPKLYNLDPEQKDELILIIEKLLSDRTTLVVGSAVMAFDEVCPERVDLIHKNYRKLCNLLIDVDEWGQVIIISMLTRYARTQFTDPNTDADYDAANDVDGPEKPFYEEDATSSSSSEEDIEKSSAKQQAKATPIKYTLEADHRLLLRQTHPLLQSRNASVVMAVAQLYHHVAPRAEVVNVAKALIRLLRSHREVQSVVLTCIASMSIKRKSIFEPFMKSFFVRTSDPTQIKLLKLEILTNLATATSISVILREFQTYISSNQKDFVAATIQAIGRCASSIAEVTETCLTGLVHLLSNRDEYVVAESVCVIKKLLQTKAAEHYDIIVQMAKLLDFIAVPAARAAILWLIGEYNEHVPLIAPDVLRKMAKSFVDEQDVVKLQVLNLAVKLYITNPTQTELLCQYVFSLARFDQNYDIRDRGRFLKQFILPSNGETLLSKSARNVFLANKPAPALDSHHHERAAFQLGSLSHYLNMRATGYRDLPQFPAVASDSSCRNVEIPPVVSMPTMPAGSIRGIVDGKEKTAGKKKNNGATQKETSFYSESDGESEYSESEEASDESDSESENDDKMNKVENNKDIIELADDQKLEDKLVSHQNDVKKPTKNKKEPESSSSENDDAESESEDDESDSDTTDSDESSEEASSSSSSEAVKQNMIKATVLANKLNGKKPPLSEQKNNLDLLLDLSDIPPPSAPLMTPSMGGFLSPLATPNAGALIGTSPFELIGPSLIAVDTQELLNKINGFGLGCTYRFMRAPHLFSNTMVSVELIFTNHSIVDLINIRIVGTHPNLNEFAAIEYLSPKTSISRVLCADFKDSTQPISFEIRTSEGVSKVTLKAPIGEIIRSVRMTSEHFDEQRSKLRGMNEQSGTAELSESLLKDNRLLQRRVFELGNVAAVVSTSDDVLLFAGQTMASKSTVLITIELSTKQITVNCEKMVVASMLLSELKSGLRN